jgi:hypothetical protein
VCSEVSCVFRGIMCVQRYHVCFNTLRSQSLFNAPFLSSLFNDAVCSSVYNVMGGRLRIENNDYGSVVAYLNVLPRRLS